METGLTNLQVQSFLTDFEKNTTVEILEEAKSTSDVVKKAKARGIDLKNNRDLAGFKAVYTIADITDANGQILPKEQLLKALPGLIGKPVNINHDRRYCVGHYIDYNFSQKTNQAIAYGVFYKSNFDTEWETAKAFFKSGKLGMSSEIWSPKDSWKYLQDGSFVLGKMELAGGALVLPPDEPAVKGANVLAVAKKKMDMAQDYELIYSKKYNDEEILISDEVKTETSPTKEVPTEEPLKVENPNLERSRVKCSNCGEELAPSEHGNVKCPKCKAILDASGQMLYPPQIMNFSLTCPNPSCGIRNWLIVNRNDKKMKVRCNNCSKEYDVEFGEDKPPKAAEILEFVYSTTVSCHQCGNNISISGVSTVPKRSIKCKKCGLEFDIEVGKSEKIKIKSIKELLVEKKPAINPEGEKIMEKKDKEDVVTSVEETPVEEKVVEEVVEISTEVVEEEKPVEEVKEEKVEEVVEEKVEEVVKEEEVVEEPLVEEVKEVVEEAPVVEEVVEEKVAEVPVEEVVEEPVDSISGRDIDRGRIRSLIKTLRKERETVDSKIDFYKTNAKLVNERRIELGDFAKNLSDEDLVNEDKFKIAKYEKELDIKTEDKIQEAVNKANEEKIAEGTVADAINHMDELSKDAKKINEKAFSYQNKKKEKE